MGCAYTDDITLLDGNVSPEHGVFEVVGEKVVYTDNGFGTFVNDKDIVGETVTLSPEDRVSIGPVIITYTLKKEEIHPAHDLSSNKLSFNENNLTHPTEPAEPMTGTSSPPEDDSSWMVSSPIDDSPETPSPPDKSYYQMYSIPRSDNEEILYYLDNEEPISDLEEECISDPEEDEESEQLKMSDDSIRIIVAIVFVALYLFFVLTFDSC
ncbi:MAG: FHA domain-containing protein [Deltaproteobacteria bacterium]|nr:FHA domain-containing protein [Candidatus Zymogenaceae bacterium]